MVTICPACKLQVQSNLPFCTNCGKRLNDRDRTVKVKWEETPKETRKAIIPKYVCNTCLKPLQYVNQYGKWYCKRCNFYDPPSLTFPENVVLNCPNCGELLTYMQNYKKWYCYRCSNYTLVLDQFYFEPNENVKRVFDHVVFCTYDFYKKIIKSASWEDIGDLMILDKNLFYNGKKFKFKTCEILDVYWASSGQDFRQALSEVAGQDCWIFIKYKDTLNLTKAAILSIASSNEAWLDKGRATELFNSMHNIWQKTMKPQKVVRSVDTGISEKRDRVDKIQTKDMDSIEEIDKKGIKVLSGINYEHARVIYKIKIENKSKGPISDIKITPFVPNEIFMLDSEKKGIPLIKKGEAKTVTFKLRPKGECGNVNISGNITYFDTKTEDYNEIKINEKPTQIICPMLKTKPLVVDDWQEAIGNLISVKETTDEIALPSDELFDIVSDVIKDMNMYMLQPKISKTRYVGRFYAEGLKGFKYGVKVEVIGALQKSKLILNVYSENQECLIGFYYKILDEIEDRTNIKQFLKEPIIIQGDYIVGGQKVDVRDSVLQRTKIGGKSDKDIDGESEADVDWE